MIPTESLPGLVERPSRPSKDLEVMATQTDTMAGIRVITLGRQKTIAAPSSARRRGEEGCSVKPEISHDQNIERVESFWQAEILSLCLDGHNLRQENS